MAALLLTLTIATMRKMREENQAEFQ